MVLGLVIGALYLIWDFLYWTKFLASVVTLWIKKIPKRRRFDLYDFESRDDPEKITIIAPKEERILESPLPEEELQKSSDEIFMYGVSSKSEALVVRISRNCNDESEAWIYLKLSDGRVLQLDQTKGYQCNTDVKSKTFTCGGLKMYPLCAMRRWRVVYSGMLRERKLGEVSQPIFVKFTFIWIASSDVYDTTSDLQTKGTAKAMAGAKWTSLLPPVEKLDMTLNSYCQSGVLNGIVKIDDEPEKEMYLFGERIRYLGEKSNMDDCNFKTILGVIPLTGLFIHLNKLSIPNLVHNLYSGYIVNPSSKIDIIEDGLIVSKMTGTHEKTQQNLSVTFKAENQYELQGCATGQRICLCTDTTSRENIDMVEINFKIDGYSGYGFMFSGDCFKGPKKTELKYQKVSPFSQKSRPLTVCFTEEESHLAELAGGKGSSLGKLMKLSSEMKSEFVVPQGIVVTTEAYNTFLTTEITEKIQKMKNIIYGNIDGNIDEACKTVKESVENASLPKQITQEIESKLKSLYPNNLNEVKFAVRSSATGEDTEQMSAAGQMETYLGIRGLAEVLNAVKKCWASQFSFIAVEYKRQNGQILNSPMAVVIQEMVDCDYSGVLFTCDPLTNNPSVVVITSNYGLGESVVSGSEEPDTIFLQRLSNDEVEIKDITIGLKKRKIILAESSLSQEDGTVLQDVPEDKQNECSVPRDVAIRLGKLSLKIENYFKSLRDIEWGIKNNNIFILQSRPITTGEATCDYEITHELDGPLRSEDEYFTTCNVGEVMPNAMSPLGFEVLYKTFSVMSMQKFRIEMARNYYLISKYFPTGLPVFYNHLFISATDILTLASDDFDSMDTKGLMMAIFGRLMDDPGLKAKCKQKQFPAPKFKVKGLLYYIWGLFLSRRDLEKIKGMVFNYQSPALQCRTSKDIFQILLKFFSHIYKPCSRHMDCSMASSSWNMYVLSTLANSKGGIDDDVYSDFAKLLATSSNVESGNIPEAMQILAQTVTKYIDKEKFKSMPIEDVQQYLETSSTEAGIKYRQFIKRHGHRCLNEMDVYTIPWSMDPKPLIQLLQSMSGSGEEAKTREEPDFSTILPHLKTPLNLKSKLLLRFLLPQCRNGIRGRETCKSTLVKSVDNIRKGFYHLSKVMKAEGYLPDSELLFFLVFDEINDLLETRNPRIIARAKHRRKLFPFMDTLTFPEMSQGVPVPINVHQDAEVKYEANLTMKGIPVSQGTVKGYARVALTITEAASLKPGEILITRSTDVAWSPFFPFLGGVVTELGGLISHGAVISREYGIPCVVGLHGATKQFVTGDYVLLDGNKGILQRLSLEETQ